MKTLVVLAGAIVALAPGTLAAPNKPTRLHCPVMTGNLVDVKDATARGLYADYKGNRYYFCCNMCPSAFRAAPARYAKGEHVPAPRSKAARVRKR